MYWALLTTALLICATDVQAQTSGASTPRDSLVYHRQTWRVVIDSLTTVEITGEAACVRPLVRAMQKDTAYAIRAVHADTTLTGEPYRLVFYRRE